MKRSKHTEEVMPWLHELPRVQDIAPVKKQLLFFILVIEILGVFGILKGMTESFFSTV
jgi:hypothetical protein